MKDLILEIRNRLNASQEDLARMIGISFATVNRWENGHPYDVSRWADEGSRSKNRTC